MGSATMLSQCPAHNLDRVDCQRRSVSVETETQLRYDATGRETFGTLHHLETSPEWRAQRAVFLFSPNQVSHASAPLRCSSYGDRISQGKPCL